MNKLSYSIQSDLRNYFILSEMNDAEFTYLVDTADEDLLEEINYLLSADHTCLVESLCLLSLSDEFNSLNEAADFFANTVILEAGNSSVAPAIGGAALATGGILGASALANPTVRDAIVSKVPAFKLDTPLFGSMGDTVWNGGLGIKTAATGLHNNIIAPAFSAAYPVLGAGGMIGAGLLGALAAKKASEAGAARRNASDLLKTKLRSVDDLYNQYVSWNKKAPTSAEDIEKYNRLKNYFTRSGDVENYVKAMEKGSGKFKTKYDELMAIDPKKRKSGDVAIIAAYDRMKERDNNRINALDRYSKNKNIFSRIKNSIDEYFKNRRYASNHKLAPGETVHSYALKKVKEYNNDYKAGRDAVNNYLQQKGVGGFSRLFGPAKINKAINDLRDGDDIDASIAALGESSNEIEFSNIYYELLTESV